MRDMREESYREYVTDNLRIIGQNTSRAGGSYYSKRWRDLIRDTKPEHRTPVEIKNHMKEKLARLGQAEEDKKEETSDGSV